MNDEGPEKHIIEPVEILDQPQFLRMLSNQVFDAAHNKTNLTLIMLALDTQPQVGNEVVKIAAQLLTEKAIGLIAGGNYGIILPKLDSDNSLATAAVFLQTVSVLLSGKGLSSTPTMGIAFAHPSDGNTPTALYGRAFDALTAAQEGDKKIAVVLRPNQKLSLDGLTEALQTQITLVDK